MNEIEPKDASQENIPDAETIRKTAPTKTTWSPFEPVTSPWGQRISRLHEPKSARRHRIRFDIFEKDTRIPCMKLEVTARDILCSLMERQDRMNDEIFSRINDLVHRVEDLERTGRMTGAEDDPGTASGTIAVSRQ
jgi:hypothetical protein